MWPSLLTKSILSLQSVIWAFIIARADKQELKNSFKYEK